MAMTENSSSGTILRSPSPSPKLHRPPLSPSRLRFPLDRSISSSASASVVSGQKPARKRLCSSTTHPGSFQCARHRRSEIANCKTLATPMREFPVSDGLHLRKSAVVNSLLRMGGLEGELAKRTMASLLRPRRRSEFRPRPSRFSVVCNDQGL